MYEKIEFFIIIIIFIFFVHLLQFLLVIYCLAEVFCFLFFHCFLSFRLCRLKKIRTKAKNNISHFMHQEPRRIVMSTYQILSHSHFSTFFMIATLTLSNFLFCLFLSSLHFFILSSLSWYLAKEQYMHCTLHI